MSAATATVHMHPKHRAPAVLTHLDPALLLMLAALAALGLIMVGSSSVSIGERYFDDPFFYMKRQAVYLAAGLLAGWVVLQIKLDVYPRLGPLLLLAAYALLLLVLIPGVGHTVKGSTRWIPLGIFNMQVSEAARILIFLYFAGMLVRRGEAIRQSFRGFLAPMAVLGVTAFLLLLEPDFGAAVVIVATGMTLLFLHGAPLWRFLVLGIVTAAAAAALVLTSEYRRSRLTAFSDPWADPFDSGFQLTQSLIAFGRGEWFGVGLGGSIQKMFYLPEAHTDFVFAVLAEELGFVGVMLTLGLFLGVIAKAFTIGQKSLRNQRPFAGYLCMAIGLWLAFQVFINMGVAMGLLPTKGLTLPLMSYGGSSLLTTCVTMALLLRADYELRVATLAASTQPRRRAS